MPHEAQSVEKTRRETIFVEADGIAKYFLADLPSLCQHERLCTSH